MIDSPLLYERRNKSENGTDFPFRLLSMEEEQKNNTTEVTLNFREVRDVAVNRNPILLTEEDKAKTKEDLFKLRMTSNNEIPLQSEEEMSKIKNRLKKIKTLG